MEKEKPKIVLPSVPKIVMIIRLQSNRTRYRGAP